MTAAAHAPFPGDATATGLARITAGFAAVHAAHAVLSLLLVDTAHRTSLVAVDAAVALGFAVTAVLVATRRLPGWRRDDVAALIPVVAAAATAARVVLIQSAWPAAEFVLAAAATAFVTSTGRFRAAGGACMGLALLTVVAMAATGTSEQAEAWLGTAVVVTMSGGCALAIRHVRLHADAVVEVTRRQLAEQSVRDPISGVANRAGLMLVAQPMIDQARRRGEAVHCLMVDVDTLRDRSDDPAVTRGDDLLIAVADALRAATRTTDVIARWDGDEFVVLGPGTGTSPLEMERRVRSHLALTAAVPREAWQGRVSAGVATLVPWDADDVDGLLQRAGQDMALRRSLRRRATADVQQEEPQTPVADVSDH